MKRLTIAAVCTLALFTLPSAAAAQGRGKSGGPKPRPSGGAASHASSGSHGPKVSPAGGAAHKPGGPRPAATTRKTSPAPQAAGSKTHGPRSAAHSTPAGNTHASSKPDRASNSSASSAAGKNSNTAANTTTTSTATAPATGGTNTPAGAGNTGVLGPVQQKLQRNTQLASKLQSRLPAGTDLMTAASGFRNLGQFVAAVNVSTNLGLDFTRLKTSMVEGGSSLGQAIQSQRRTVDGNTEAVRAQRDADAMIRATESTGSNVTSGSSVTSGSKAKGR